MFPVLLEQWLSQNQNLLKKLNYSVETSNEGKVLLQCSDWKWNGVYYCGISLTINSCISVFHFSSVLCASHLCHLHFPFFFCHATVYLHVTCWRIFSAFPLPAVCSLGLRLRPHLSVISCHRSVLSPPALCRLVSFLCCFGSLFCHLSLLVPISFCTFVAVSCYFYSIFITCQSHALTVEEVHVNYKAVLLLCASGRSKKETCLVSASIISVLSALPLFKLLML